MNERNYRVTVSRVVEITSANPFDAGQRALDLVQRQRAWPGELHVEVTELIEESDE